MQERFDRAQQRHAAQMQQHAKEQAHALEAAAAQGKRAAHDAAAAQAAVVSSLEGQLWQAQAAAQVRHKTAAPIFGSLAYREGLNLRLLSSSGGGSGFALSMQQRLGLCRSAMHHAEAICLGRFRSPLKSSAGKVHTAAGC